MAIVAVAFIAISFVTWQSMGGGAGLESGHPRRPGPRPGDLQGDHHRVFGLGCPACQIWHNTRIREQILAAFPDQVRFVWKDFPVVTPQSPEAAQSGQCAGAQGKFWAYHDQVFENFGGLERGTVSTYATAVGLDVAAFDKCWMMATCSAKSQPVIRKPAAWGFGAHRVLPSTASPWPPRLLWIS